jgi:uncharacterized protein GlcG (DUF336 family)
MTFRADLNLDQANAIAEGAFKEAARLDLKPIAVMVLDAGGHLIAYQRQDGCSLMRFNIALAKAAGALGMGMSSRKLAGLAADRPAFAGALSSFAPDGLAPAPGGVLIAGADGKIIGAVGVTGDTSDNDELCALAGLAAAHFAAFD